MDHTLILIPSVCVSGPIYGYARGDHLACFANNRDKLNVVCSWDKLAGLYSLRPEDQDKNISQLPDVESKVDDNEPDEPNSKKAK